VAGNAGSGGGNAGGETNVAGHVDVYGPLSSSGGGSLNVGHGGMSSNSGGGPLRVGQGGAPLLLD